MATEANAMELAARALLHLKCASGRELEMEEAATLFLSHMLIHGTPPRYILRSEKTCDQETQTALAVQSQAMTMPDMQRMDVLISGLRVKLNSLENQLQQIRSASPFGNELDPDVSTDLLNVQQYDDQQKTNNMRKSRNFSFCDTDNSHNMNMDTSEDQWKPTIPSKSSKQIISEMLKPRARGNDMVQIGHGYASVPARILSQMNWLSYSAATRKLLEAVFSRQVLATHSLTGKSSPAFPGKPAKKQLDPRLVDDIVQVVVERCGVLASRVRTIITTKCADESKMLRQQNIKKEQ